ncbi:MAG TPA: hypothetical protein P5571_15015 [Candidatus Krumholzibacteria bacterium]|nr:hypothetical protein [Candidatus Krumholzibacteria bacterium]HRX52678.1 hypothetical protein [Candidatus Krumholzibacteria bacterium]
MKIRYGFLLLGIVILLPGLVSAQADPDPDGIGLYADLGATQNSIDVEVWELFDVYIIGTNFSEETVSYWECSLQADPGVLVHEWEIYHEPTGYVALMDEMSFGAIKRDGLECAVLADVEPALPLARLTLVVIEPGTKTISMDWPLTGEQPMYNSFRICNEHLPGVELHPSNGTLGEPLFVINGQAPVAEETVSWSAVKALYR